MAIAKLSIDLEARLAGLQAGLDKAGLLAERQAARIEASFAGLKTLGVGLGAGLAAAFTVPAIAAFVSRTAEGIDKLNDLKDATGSSVENLSALEDIALRTGTSMDTAGDAVIKLNKALIAASDPGSDAAAAIKALGLSLDELKRLDPVEALQKVGTALNGFADNGAKGRLELVLLGKGMKDLAPLLKDLAEAGKLNATVTTEQAEAAEKFRKEMFALDKNVTDASRAIAGPLISAINALLAKMREGASEGKPLWAALLGESELLRIAGLTGGVTDYSARIAALNKLLAEGGLTQERRVRLEKQLADLRAKADQTSQRAIEDRGFIPTINRPSLPDTLGGGDEKAKKAKKEKAGIDGLLVNRQEAFRAGELALQQNAEEALRLERLIKLEAEHALAIKATVGTRQEDFRASELAAQQGVNEALRLERLTELEKTHAAQVSAFAEQAARNIQDALGNTLEASLHGNFDNIGRLWGDLLIRMASEAAAARIGQELFGDFGKGGSTNIGGSIGSLLALLPSFAVGTDYVPRDMVARIHQGERIVPAGQNARGGGGLTYSPIINIDSRTDQAVVGQLVAGAVQEGQRQMLQHLQATGVLQ